MHPAILNIVESLRTARKSRGMSQRELGARVGLTQAQISKIEGGRVDPRLSSTVELARGLGVEVMLVPRRVVPAALTLGVVPNPGDTRAGSGDG